MKDFFSRFVMGVLAIFTGASLLVFITIWGILTFFLYMSPVMIGISDRPSKILGIIGIVVGLRILMKIAR